MCFSSPKIPEVKPPPEQPKDLDGAAKRARSDQAKKAMLMAGLAGTNVTGGLGVGTNAATATKTLLGQ
jgi:hypothetical protein